MNPNAMQTFLSGPVICGLYGMFEDDYGRASTPTPYARVTPSKVASALLPFQCPSCKGAVDFSDPETREHYHDTRKLENGTKRDNYWCPKCDTRFVLNMKGKQFDGTLVNGVAPSIVERISVDVNGLVDLKRTEHGNASVGNVITRLNDDYVAGIDIILGY